MRRWLGLVVAVVACGEPAELRPLPARTPAPWSIPDVRPELEGAFFDAHPALRDLSIFAGAVDDPPTKPDPEHRGAYGVGNGLAVAIVGLGEPMNALHGIVGPIYDKGDRFFGDVGLRVVVDDAVRTLDREAIGRPRGTGTVVVRSDAGDVTFTTVDFAPRPAGAGPEEVPPALVRFVIVRAAAAHRVALAVPTVDDLLPVDGGLDLARADGRALRIASTLPLAPAEGGARLDLGELEAGEEVVVPLVLAFGTDGPSARATADAVLAANLEDWLDQTLDAWLAEAARGTQLDLDDPALVDLIDTLRVTLRVQQSAEGSIVPVSRYTGTWLRDSIGPVRMWTRLGLFDEARAAVRYLHLCHRKRGDYGNACDSGLTEADVTGDPDWANLPPFSGRTAAEGPSHVPLAWSEIVRWTGDDAELAAMWPYLRRSVLAQTLTPDGFQPWSGDETFRLAMEVALGWPLNTAWQDLSWSSNSNLVLLPAARFLADVAHDVAPEDEAALREIAERARAGLDAFVRPEGHLAAVILRDPEAAPEDRPFEDAALAALWTGALAPEDPVAVANLQGLLAVAGRADGSVQTPPAYDLGGDLSSGVATGMLPGYALWNLVATGHPSHPAALDQMLAYATSSGEYVEGQRYGDRLPLQPLYDAAGTIGDTAARYRPWEGGIDGDAILFDLLGAAPIPGGLHLAPRVPHGLDHLGAGPILAPGVTASVDVAWDGEGWTVEVANDGAAAFELQLDLPLGVWDDVDVEVSSGALAVLPLGERVARFDAATVAPGATWTGTVRSASAR